MVLSKAQQKRIDALCEKYQGDMQKLVEEPGSSITGISIQVGNGPLIEIAKQKKENNHG